MIGCEGRHEPRGSVDMLLVLNFEFALQPIITMCKALIVLVGMGSRRI